MKFWLNIFLFILFSCGGNSLHGQENLLDEFTIFTQRQLQEYDQTVRKMNKEFASYLKQAWQPFDAHYLEPLQKDPDIPVGKPSISTSAVTRIPTRIETSQVKDIKRADIKPVLPDMEVIEINYFGTIVDIPCLPDYKIFVRSSSENDVSNAWNRAADVDFSYLFETLKKHKQQLNLNDWGFLLLVQKAAEAIYNGQQNHASIFLTAYCMNQLSQSVRMGRMDNKLVLLLEIQETMYDIPQINCGGKTYTLLCKNCSGGSIRIMTYAKSFPKATQCLSMALPQLPLLSENIQTRYLPNQWQDTIIKVTVNKNLIDFYATMPHTEFTVYGKVGLSSQIYSLMDKLKKHLHGKDNYEAAALLLDFVQNTFEYQSDRQQFGREKVFFPDEMLYFPYNDCEDRAILFCHLVRALLGLKVALVNYPNHIAAAVCFPKSMKAETQYHWGNETYTLCDPTYLGAGIGECMPQFLGKKPKLILLSE
ncbi:MAG: hypothetical protein SOR57_11945 [Parabacteroides sp.]|nr:hypothetical protein [Parabacteroides sp.]